MELEVIRRVLEEIKFKIVRDVNLTQLDQENYIVIVGALEKQIPKKPIEYECPVCKDSVGYKFGESYMMPHCENCGQKLDWD